MPSFGIQRLLYCHSMLMAGNAPDQPCGLVKHTCFASSPDFRHALFSAINGSLIRVIVDSAKACMLDRHGSCGTCRHAFQACHSWLFGYKHALFQHSMTTFWVKMMMVRQCAYLLGILQIVGGRTAHWNVPDKSLVHADDEAAGDGLHKHLVCHSPMVVINLAFPAIGQLLCSASGTPAQARSMHQFQEVGYIALQPESNHKGCCSLLIMSTAKPSKSLPGHKL